MLPRLEAVAQFHVNHGIVGICQGAVVDIGILARETDVLVEIVVQSDLILRALLLGSLRGLVHVVASLGVTLLLDDRRDDEHPATCRRCWRA